MVSVFVGCICSSNGMTRECLHLSVVMGLGAWECDDHCDHFSQTLIDRLHFIVGRQDGEILVVSRRRCGHWPSLGPRRRAVVDRKGRERHETWM